jgi:two-component system sensor histidine kinase VanS
MAAGAVLLATVLVFVLRYVPDGVIMTQGPPVPNRSDLWRAFAPRAGQAMGALFVFSLVGGWILAGRMLSPLTRITAATRMVAGGDLSHRIRLPGRRDEFRELADGFDDMVARLEAHVAQQRRFAANASHELRTPLAITLSLLDVARADPDRDVGELLERLRAVNARAIDLTEALLLLSRAEQGSFTRERVDLSLIAEEAAETLLPLAERRGVAIHASGDIAPAIGSHALLLQLATNLMHNGIVHNVLENGAVWVRSVIGPDSAVLTVENTGEHLPDRLIQTLAEPFQRGAGRARSDHAGVGLGLAIAKSITQAHAGTLTLTPRAAGGLIVTVRLPAAPAAPAGADRRTAPRVGTAWPRRAV